MKIYFSMLFLLISLSPFSIAGTQDEKIIAAKRYLATTPIPTMVSNFTAQMVAHLPKDKQREYRKIISEEVNFQLLEKEFLAAMVKTFTLEELNVFADFYGSAVGKSAMSKVGSYMSLVIPAIQHEMIRAIEKVEAKN